MGYDHDVRFHCTQGIRKQGKKSKHTILTQCGTVMTVLSHNPDYGVSVSRFTPLRKMRVHVPQFRIGKRAGYRLIYAKSIIGQVVYIVFLSLYSKSNISDLDNSTYRQLLETSEAILSDPFSYDWEDFPVVE